MLLRKSTFKISGMTLFNGGVALFLIATGGFIARSMVVKEPPASCSVRYQQAMLYPWSRSGGTPYTSADLQAKLGGFDWGVIDNVSFVGGAPVLSNVAIEVALPQDAKGASKTSGTGFTWQPASIKDATSACLGYSVFLPRDLDTGTGITLPGLFGNVDTEPLGDRAPAFSTRMRWREDTKLEIVSIQPDHIGGIPHVIDPNWTKLERGRWVRIEQEIALNTPGRRNGLMRVWVDGEMKLERTDMAFRQDPAQGLRGVDASVHYSRQNHAWAPSPKTGYVRLSPFEVRWR